MEPISTNIEIEIKGNMSNDKVLATIEKKDWKYYLTRLNYFYKCKNDKTAQMRKPHFSHFMEKWRLHSEEHFSWIQHPFVRSMLIFSLDKK